MFIKSLILESDCKSNHKNDQIGKCLVSGHQFGLGVCLLAFLPNFQHHCLWQQKKAIIISKFCFVCRQAIEKFYHFRPAAIGLGLMAHKNSTLYIGPRFYSVILSFIMFFFSACRSDLVFRKWNLLELSQSKLLAGIFDASDHQVSGLRRLLLQFRRISDYCIANADSRTGAPFRRCQLKPHFGTISCRIHDFLALPSARSRGFPGK